MMMEKKFMKCQQCGKRIEQTSCYISEDMYARLKMGDPCTVVFCSEECFDQHYLFNMRIANIRNKNEI